MFGGKCVFFLHIREHLVQVLYESWGCLLSSRGEEEEEQEDIYSVSLWIHPVCLRYPQIKAATEVKV